MVFLTAINFVRNRGPDPFWRKRRIFKLSAHFTARRRNCYSLAIRSVHRALVYVTKGRELKKQDMKELWQHRADVGAKEHGIDFRILSDGLAKCDIFLNRKSLADLAIWEPRTFKALTDVACTRAKMESAKCVENVPLPKSIIPQGLIK